MQLGLLDFCMVPAGVAPADVLGSSLDLAMRADKLGYSRYWFTEHHTGYCAHSSPEHLVPIAAGLTHSIRIGTAGILVQLQSPLKIAKNFRLIEALFPGRIDLGICAGRTDEGTTRAMRNGSLPDDDYTPQVAQLADYVREASGTVVMPTGISPPELWLLGGGGARGIDVAWRKGIGYGLSLFHTTSIDDPSVLRVYRERFVPANAEDRPRCNVTVAGVCADTERDAQRLLATYADGYGTVKPTIVGTSGQCAEKLHDLVRRYEIDEVIFLELAAEPAARARSHELLAAAVGLIPRRGNDDTLGNS